MTFLVAILKINVQDVMTHVLRGMEKRIDMVIYKLLSLDHHVSINELENTMNNDEDFFSYECICMLNKRFYWELLFTFLKVYIEAFFQ